MLDCEIMGEFATHLMSAYREEVYRDRLQNIRILPRGGEPTVVALDDIWLVNPMPKKGFSKAKLRKANLRHADDFDPLLGTSLRESIRRGYHCKDEKETEFFLRRFIAS